MSTLRKQLKDPIFKAWMAKTPRKDTNPPHLNWRVLVQAKKKGSWARRDFETYAEAYAWVMSHLEDFHDIALVSKAFTFRPPIVRNQATNKKNFYYPPTEGEKWCPFCRRMTKFAWFSSHHNCKKYLCNQRKQCSICGAGDNFTQMKTWRW